MSAPLYIGAAEVAALLELPGPRSFLERRERLEREEGFPPPAPWARSPLKWRREDVLAWRDVRRQVAAVAPAAGPVRGDVARRVVMLQNARRA
jgi:hypothetical protein